MRKTLVLSRKNQKWLGVFLLSLSVSWGVMQLNFSQIQGWSIKSVYGQNLRPEQAAEIIYQRLPELPKENDYYSAETGEINPNHTLMGRFIRYHKDFKRRSPQHPLDWKVTIADYLGVNQSIRESNYPGSTLTSNPLTKDIEVMRQLSRRQRQQLVDLLVEIYNPQPQTTTNQGVPNETEGTSSPESTSETPGLSRPGDAQLLTP